MTNYIIKNCPAGQIITSAVDPNRAGVYCKKEHGPCQDCIHCVMKKLISRYKGCSYILEWLDIEEVKE